MSRVKKRLNELREQGVGALLRLGGGAARGYISRRLAAYGMAAGAGLGAGAAINSYGGPRRQIYPGHDPQAWRYRPTKLPKAQDLPGTETVAKAIPKAITATATKTATLQPTRPQRPQRKQSPKSPKRTARVRPGGDSDEENRKKDDSSVQEPAPPPKTSIYSKVAQVLRRR